MDASSPSAKIEALQVSTYTIPTQTEECDGTYCWSTTTLVLAQVTAGGQTGLGYTYANHATAVLIDRDLRHVIMGREAMNVRGIWDDMRRAVRNLGGPGVSATAISAVDVALWDLKAKLLGLPLVCLLGQVHDKLPVYGSGGFCNYSTSQLQEQLRNWVESGIPRVKMKIGRDARLDRLRVGAAREAVDVAAQLLVDANGGYDRKEALAAAEAFAGMDVTWFEEPVSSDDLEGLRLLRDRAPARIEVAAGEYGYEAPYFRRMLQAGAVDVLQADVTRCGGITGFLQVGALCDAFHIPLSAHCAPALHVHCGCAVSALRHAEYFFDHVRIEHLFFDGVPAPREGALFPDLHRAGLGLEFKASDAERYLCNP